MLVCVGGGGSDVGMWGEGVGGGRGSDVGRC